MTTSSTSRSGLPTSTTSAVGAEQTFASRDWPLWSTTARVVVDDPAKHAAAIAIADRLTAAVDHAASRFRHDSEVNRLAAELPSGARVSPLLARLVRAAISAAERSDGDVDPTLGQALVAVGYDRDIRLVADDDGRLVRAVATVRPGWRSLVLEGDRLRLPGHLALDLGATAKALTADDVAAEIHRTLGCSVLVALGGDIATAGPGPVGGWQVRAQDRPGDPMTTVSLRGGWAVATSSTQHRAWTRGGERMHHILDPRTGLPAEAVWRSVSVAARSCVEANTLSTAAIVRGMAALPWLAALGLPARLVDADGRVLVLGGWPLEVADDPTGA
ncbi:FAD:protein FMN transferase [Schumannella soli]|uniref:FAD:protein FMN transferase n=1 Tax=Schumannella soli TaxID=2590779 RepID=A0A506Y3U2_9MICO|nr:FAD:protein FMN transferase [Schumannella soli]TPW75668.1 FAD:protein FMN transferase [Schumannella soli]